MNIMLKAHVKGVKKFVAQFIVEFRVTENKTDAEKCIFLEPVIPCDDLALF